MPTRLSERSLAGLAAASKPKYSRHQVRSGIVHLGIGGFHRAHQAVYTDDLLASGDHRWGITGASLRSSSAREALAPQDFLYTVQTLGANAEDYRVIGSVLNVLAAPQPGHLTQLLELIANPDTQVVTLTITEKGYCSDHQGELDSEHREIVHDLNHPDAPRSAPGVLAQGVAQRMRSGAGPLTVLSCDNLAGNGRVAGNVVRTLLQQTNQEAASWLADNVSFPASMVDRIVPQVSAVDLAAFESATGYSDFALIGCEAFSQWVIEDRFAGRRPAWDVAGAQFVEDVAPFEQAKLRLLNASHSALAYLGLLAGYEHVHQAIADSTLAGFARALLDDEITPVVICPTGMDLSVYKTSILDRFANAAVPYRTQQVAADGSQKLTQRILPTIKERLHANLPIARLCLVMAGWLQCLTGRADDSTPLSINDPMAQQIVELSQRHTDTNNFVRAVAQATSHFGELAQSELFLQTLTDALVNIRRQGSLASAKALALQHG